MREKVIINPEEQQLIFMTKIENECKYINEYPGWNKKKNINWK